MGAPQGRRGLAQRAVAPDDKEGAAATRVELLAAIEEVTARCREERAAHRASEQPEDLSDEAPVAARASSTTCRSRRLRACCTSRRGWST